MKYTIEADDIAGAITRLARLYAQDKSKPDQVKLQCTLTEPRGVRIIVQRLNDEQTAKAVESAEKSQARRARADRAAAKKAAKKRGTQHEATT